MTNYAATKSVWLYFMPGAKYPNSRLKYEWCVNTLSNSVSLGGDAAHNYDGRKVAPHVRDVVDTRRRLGGLPGRREERLGAKPVALAPHQSWRDLHPGPGAGRTHSTQLPRRHSFDVCFSFLILFRKELERSKSSFPHWTILTNYKWQH